MDGLLSDLHDFFDAVSAPVQREERDIISQIDTARSVDSRHSHETRDIAGAIGDWLLAYFEYVVSSRVIVKIDTCDCFRRRLVTLEELPLWDIWYTGSTPFPSEV